MSDQATLDEFETEIKTDGGEAFEVVAVYDDDDEDVVATRPTRAEANEVRREWQPGVDEPEPFGMTVRKADAGDDEQPGISGSKLCNTCGDEIPASTSGGKCDDCTLEGYDPDDETVTDAWEGEFIAESWGYGQTNVDFAQIVDVSDTGKTVLARLVPAGVADRHKSSESVEPEGEPYGEEFRLHVRASVNDKPAFRGSYPYVDGDSDNGTRKGSFMPVTGTMHQTATGYGH